MEFSLHKNGISKNCKLAWLTSDDKDLQDLLLKMDWNLWSIRKKLQCQQRNQN